MELIDQIKAFLLPELDAIRAEQKAINDKFGFIEKRLDSIDAHLIEQSRRIDTTNEKIDRVRDELTKRIDETNKRIDETNKRIDETNKRIDSVKDELTKRIDETNKRIDELTAKVVYEKDVSEIKSQMFLLQERYIELKAKVAA